MARNKRSLLAGATHEMGRNKRLRLSTETNGDGASPVSLGSNDSRDEDEDKEEDAGVTDPDEDDGGVTDPDDQDSMDLDRRREEDVEDVRELSDNEAMERVQQMRDRRVGVENHAADNAIIEEVSCTNFMCHAALSIKMGPLINFIIGHNGSGKSAVLTALTICLGGKASATSRGQSLKSFIKEGSEKCTLKVRIKNQGRSAYKADVFGPSIVIERFFSRSGASGYHIRTHQGKSVSKSKTDVDDILDYYALQLDNPMNVLTQDMARAFLNSASPKDKYKFFNKGTQLETLDKDYMQMEETLNEIEFHMATILEQRGLLKQKCESAKKAAERVAGQRKMQGEINRIRMQMCWVQVEKQEANVEEHEEHLAQLQASVTTLKEEFTQSETALAELTKRSEDATEKHNKLKEEEFDPLVQEKDEAHAEFQTLKNELHEALGTERTLKTNLDGVKKSLTKIQQEIASEKAKIEQTDDRTAEIHSRLETEKDTLVQARGTLKSIEQQFPPAEEAFKQARDKEERTKCDMNQQSEKVRACQSRIKELSAKEGGIALPLNIKNLLQDIERSTRFKQKPVGPMSQYVKLKDPKWSSILERQFGMALNAFVVTSRADSDELHNLTKKYRINVPVYIGNSRPIDTRGHEPPEEFLTWLRVLSFDNDLIRNQCIINQGIEKTVLVESREEANHVLTTQDPRNVKQIFCFTDEQSGKKRGSGIRLAKSPSGGTSLSPIKAWEGSQRMRTDVAAQRNFENDNLHAEQETLSEVKKTCETARQATGDKDGALNRLKRELRAQRQKIDRLEESVAKLSDELEEATPQTGVLEEFERKLAEEQARKELITNQYAALLADVSGKKRDQKERHDEMKKMDENINIIKEKVKKAQSEVSKLEIARSDQLIKKNRAAQDVRFAETAVETEEGAIQAEREKLAEVVEQASSYFERVPVDRGETYDSLNRKFEKMEAELKKAQQRMGGSEEELKARELKAKEDYEKKCFNFDEAKKLSQSLKMSLADRRNRWTKFKEYITIRAKISFSYLLSERQFRGDLIIRHADKELELHVEPDITRKSDKGRTTKTLSGGEKSFSTICMLLALWEAMGSPIRCLDEFDVFMDNVNRDVSVKMLIGAARRAVSRQFVLITPQSIGNIPAGPDIKIHKMKDPERGQQALPFMAQTQIGA